MAGLSEYRNTSHQVASDTTLGLLADRKSGRPSRRLYQAQTTPCYCSKCSDAPRPEASAPMRIASFGTPAAFSESTIAWARDKPRVSAAD